MELNLANLAILTTGVQTVYQTAFNDYAPKVIWDKLATDTKSTTKQEIYPWLGQSTSFREWLGDRVAQNLAVHSYTIPNKTFENTVTEMQRRWNALVYKEGAMVQALRGTPGTLGTQLAAMNSQFLDSYCSQNTPTAPFVEAAMIAAAYAFNLAQRPNAPQKGTPLPGLMPPVQADRFILSERNTLYLEGGSSWIVEKDGTVVLERAVTTYKTNASGTPDTSYHGRWTMATLMYLRYSWVNWMNAKFPNFTLADDGTPVVAGEVTPAILGRETFAWYKAMQKLGLVQDAKGFYAALVSIRDLQNVSRNDQLMAPRLVPPLDIIAGQMAFVE